MSEIKLLRKEIPEHLEEMKKMINFVEEICKDKSWSDEEVNQYLEDRFFRRIDYECETIKYCMLPEKN